MVRFVGLTLVIALAGCGSTAPVAPVRYAAELAVPQDSLDALPDLSNYPVSPGQVILLGTKAAGSGTALRTESHGLVILTNRHVAAGLSPDGGPTFAFWPEPEREVEGWVGRAYTAAPVRTLIPNASTLRSQQELLDRFEVADPSEATSPEDLRQRMRTIALGVVLRIVEPDLALLQVLEGPADLDDLPAAPLAERAPGKVEMVFIYPERGSLWVELGRDEGTLRAAPTSGGKYDRETATDLGAQEGNSGTGLFTLRDELCGVISGCWDSEGTGEALPEHDPRPETPALIEVIQDPDAGVKPLAAALKRLMELWKPHAQLGGREHATLLIRLEELRFWLDRHGVEVE